MMLKIFFMATFAHAYIALLRMENVVFQKGAVDVEIILVFPKTLILFYLRNSSVWIFETTAMLFYSQ